MQQASLAPASPAPLRIIYIMGAGRSGSTVLDTILGNHPDILSVGEISNLHFAGWTQDNYCSCGVLGKNCPFWNGVLGEWQMQTGGAGVAEYLELQSRFERFGWRQWLTVGWESVRHSAKFDQYLAQTRALYTALAATSGKRIIVDSSKSPLRATLLRMIPEFDVRVLHLVRDGRAVVWSRKKAFRKDKQAGLNKDMPPRPVWYSVSFWMFVNLLSGWVRESQREHTGLIRYEDFVERPAEILAEISRIADVDFSDVARRIAADEDMPVGHTIAGNRLRMSGRVKLGADWEWMEKLPRSDRRACWKLAGWLLERYHYSA